MNREPFWNTECSSLLDLETFNRVWGSLHPASRLYGAWAIVPSAALICFWISPSFVQGKCLLEGIFLKSDAAAWATQAIRFNVILGWFSVHLFLLAAQADRPQCVYSSAQKEGCCEAVTETPASVQVKHCLFKGEWKSTYGTPGFALGLTSEGDTDLVFLQKVLLKEIPELSNYIDRSQLTAPLGGYLIYCHRSWVAFIKVISFWKMSCLCQ